MNQKIKFHFFKENEEYKIDDFFKNYDKNKELLFLIECKILNINNLSFKFRFVGMISLNNYIIIVLPKYIQSIKNYSEEDFKKKSKILFKIFQKYSSKNSHESSLLEKDYTDKDDYFNLFALYKSLVDNYIEYGLYEKEKPIHSICGNGEIDWNKTIDETENHFNSLKNPIYLDYFTYDIEEEQENYIRRIQKKLLTEAGSYLEEFKKFGIDEFNFDFHFDMELIGDIEFQIYKIDCELRDSFSEIKLNLLNLMKSLLIEKKHSGYEGVNLYGTKSYHSVWENICQDVLNNNEDIRRKIPKPEWIPLNNSPVTISTLVPDIVIKEKNKIYILDAKYYTTSFDENGKIKNSAPGIGDISKQFLYEKSYEIKFKDENLDFYNAFLFPIEDTKHSRIGEIKFELFPNKSIDLLKLSVDIMYELYLNNRKENIKNILKNV